MPATCPQVEAKEHASRFRVLVLLGVAAAFCAAFLPHVTESSVASKLAEANHPAACPPQWLPVILAANIPVPTTDGGRLLTLAQSPSPPPPSPSPPPPSAPALRESVDLGTAEGFALLTKTGITTTPGTQVTALSLTLPLNLAL